MSMVSEVSEAAPFHFYDSFFTKIVGGFCFGGF